MACVREAFQFGNVTLELGDRDEPVGAVVADDASLAPSGKTDRCWTVVDSSELRGRGNQEDGHRGAIRADLRRLTEEVVERFGSVRIVESDPLDESGQPLWGRTLRGVSPLTPKSRRPRLVETSEAAEDFCAGFGRRFLALPES